MSAEVLREAAREIRGGGCDEGHQVCREDDPFLLAVADWLDHAAESADLLRSPYVNDHLTAALAVARAYLGAQS